MQLSAYELTLITGGFTIVGALIATVAAYRLGIQLENARRHQAAGADLRSAFAPALAMIYLARHHGNHDRPNVVAFLEKALLDHAAAVELYRIFVPQARCSDFQEAWEAYRKEARQPEAQQRSNEWGRSAHGEILEEKINAILAHAER
jgi:hypothetical protein